MTAGHPHRRPNLIAKLLAEPEVAARLNRPYRLVAVRDTPDLAGYYV